MTRNFTSNNAKNAKNIKNGQLTSHSADSKSISSVSSVKSTTSVTTHQKKTSFVAVTKTKSVVITKAGKASGLPDSLASCNGPSASTNSVSLSKSVSIEDVEKSATKEEVIVIQTDQAESVPIADSKEKTFVSVRDSKKSFQETESSLSATVTKSITTEQTGKSTSEGITTSRTVDENTLAQPETAGSTNSFESNGKVHSNVFVAEKHLLKELNGASLDFVRSEKEAAKNGIATTEINMQLNSDEWLHYVHNWDEKSSVSSEMAASVSEMEIILSKELVRRFKNYKSDSSLDCPIFYHDHQNGHTLVHVNKDFHIEPNRRDLLRVIGCGHFLLSYFNDAISYAIEECRNVDNLEWAVSFLTSVRSEWERSALNKLTRCDEAVGIGNYFNDLASKWLALNMDHHSGEELQQWLDLNAVKFMCKTMCFSDHSQDLALTNRSAYKEFLFLHMACIVDHDESENIDPKLLKQFMLLNRNFQAPVLTETAATLAMVSLPERAKQSGKDFRDTLSRSALAFEGTKSERTVSENQENNIKSDLTTVTDGAGRTTLVKNAAMRHSSSAEALKQDVVEDTKPSERVEAHRPSRDSSDANSILTNVSQIKDQQKKTSRVPTSPNVTPDQASYEKIYLGQSTTESKKDQNFVSKDTFKNKGATSDVAELQENIFNESTISTTKTIEKDDDIQKQNAVNPKEPKVKEVTENTTLVAKESYTGTKANPCHQATDNVMDTLDRNAWLHHVHNWDEKSSVSSEMAASVSEMEIILSKELVRRFKNYKSDSSLDCPIFYHDHQNGHTLVHVNKDFHIEPNRRDLLRVIGCGHFLLSYFNDAISYAIEECRNVDNLEWAVSFLTSVRSEWERSALNKLTRCDEAVGIGNYFNDLASKWLALNVDHHSGEELQQWLDLNAVKFMCKTMCFSDHSQDLALTNRSAYKEFLFLHMACIVDHDEPENIDPKLLKQFMLLNRAQDNFQRKDSNTKHTKSSVDLSRSPVKTNKHQLQKQASKALASDRKNARLVMATLPAPSHPTKGRHQPLTPQTLGLGSASNMQLWRSYDPFEATDWFESDDGRTMKVAEQHWKLGCKGCPGGLQELPSKGEKSQRRRKCKWVTIKRTVLAKRSVSKESQAGSK